MSARQIADGLNPCCSGQWSSTLFYQFQTYYKMKSLNPCCSGQWSSTIVSAMVLAAAKVLILVVVDNGLVLIYSILMKELAIVLILVVVDNGLVHFYVEPFKIVRVS